MVELIAVAADLHDSKAGNVFVFAIKLCSDRQLTFLEKYFSRMHVLCKMHMYYDPTATILFSSYLAFLMFFFFVVVVIFW